MSKTKNQNADVTTINGIVLTPELTDILQAWQAYTQLDGSKPEEYIKYLSKIQDFLCRMLIQFDGPNPEEQKTTGEIKSLLMSLVSIKDDLEVFVPTQQIIQLGGVA